ncbi:MAG: dienelactone hydrolase family protein [Planctomycetota bacterium]|nr:dienelactone hydrolase family protein [Planctomycetota bacterium]
MSTFLGLANITELSMPYRLKIFSHILLFSLLNAGLQGDETLPALIDNQAPQNFEQMWAGFDPQAEPLESELLQQWKEDSVTLRIVRFRIGIFKGRKATLAAVYGFPDSASKTNKVPGLLQIHGGGQYADYKACSTNAKRGYATLSIAWAGRISAPVYRVGPAEVKLFWDDKTDAPNYRRTTDWGALDGYHAPGRNAGNQFPSAASAEWTLDSIESPRNSGWFLCALAARRALTFLEEQPEVDASRLGVYGHSMGGKLTVMTAVDPRVKAAAPSCGGISDRYSRSELFRVTVGDDVSLAKVHCPIMFLSPANDFHGRIGDLPRAIEEIASDDWRVTCSPHHNHQDTPEHEVATQIWMDQHLKGSFKVPETPQTTLKLDSADGVPVLQIRPDYSRPIESVDVYYTLQGKEAEQPSDMQDVIHRFWHQSSARATHENSSEWIARLPLPQTDAPLWVYANVRYELLKPISGAGYYYDAYTADSYVVSSLLHKIPAEELLDSKAEVALAETKTIEDFEGDWEQEWFHYRAGGWARTTHKLNSKLWKAPSEDAKLVLEVTSLQPNKLVVLLGDFAAEVDCAGENDTQRITLSTSDFKNFSGESIRTWAQVRRLKLSPAEHLRAPRGTDAKPRKVGGNWKGVDPKFRALYWARS